MKALNWDYITGFFEGEGCVTTHANQARRGSVGSRVIISQAGDQGRKLLEEIQRFLSDHGIRAYLHSRRGSRQKQWNLDICDRKGVVTFLRQVFPLLRVKKLIAQDTIRFFTVFPSIKGWYFRELNRLRAEAKARGERHIAVPYNGPETLRRYERQKMAYLRGEPQP